MAEISKGKYIVIEGMDGAGTTTQRDLLINAFTQADLKAISVEEPGGTPIGDGLRKIIKDADIARSAVSSLEMFMIARRELMVQRVQPALEDGVHIISDRNWLSSYAYQGHAEGLDKDFIVNRAQQALGALLNPDIRLLIDVPVPVAQARMNVRGGAGADYFEKKGPAFFEKVREGYLEAAQKYDYTVLDGTKPIEQLRTEIELYFTDILVANPKKGN